MKLTSPQTFKIVKYVLKAKEFTQLELSEKLGVSLGRVNRVIVWMKSRGFVERKGKKYQLLNPVNLLRAIVLTRSFIDMEAIFMTNTTLDKEGVIRLVKEAGGVLCLGSALEKYGGFFRAGDVSFYLKNYSRDSEKIKKKLSPYKGGILKVVCFSPDFDVEEDAVKIDGVKVTSKVQTVIDMFCDNKAYYAKDLLAELWGVQV